MSKFSQTNPYRPTPIEQDEQARMQAYLGLNHDNPFVKLYQRQGEQIENGFPGSARAIEPRHDAMMRYLKMKAGGMAQGDSPSLFDAQLPDPHELLRSPIRQGRPTESEMLRNQHYDDNLPRDGHDMTRRLRDEARALGERPPTHRDFRGPPAQWPSAEFGPNGLLRPFRRGGGSPMYEDF